MHISKHVFDGVVFFQAIQARAAVVVQIHIDRVGIAKQIVHVAQNFLVSADQKHRQQIRFAIQSVYRHVVFYRLLIDVQADFAIGIAGQILQYRAACGLLMQTVQRHDWQHLVNRPSVGQALEYREIAEVFVGQFVVQNVKHLAL